MPDRRRHRGPHPDDATLFAAEAVPCLRAASFDLSWLLGNGYPPDATAKLVGDRYDLTSRQRMAVRRMACSDHDRQARRRRCVERARLLDAAIAIDGYNLQITLESALAGAVLLRGRDGALRDLASIHGTYRRVAETDTALRLTFSWLLQCAPQRVDWYLDRPVSNSGRLKQWISGLLEADAVPFAWEIHLVNDPDRELISYEGVVVSSDSGVLDRCSRWCDAAGMIVASLFPSPWIIDADPA